MYIIVSLAMGPSHLPYMCLRFDLLCIPFLFYYAGAFSYIRISTQVLIALKCRLL